MSAVMVAAFVARHGDAGADRTPRLAVFEMEVKRVKLSRDVVSDLRDYLAQGLAASNAFRVVPRDLVRQALVREKKRSRQLCFDKTCQIEVGRALAADRTLAVAIKKFGRKCVVSAVIYDLKTEVSAGAAQARGLCGVEQIMASLDKVLTRLTGKPATPPKPSPKPAPPSEPELPPPLPGDAEQKKKPSPRPEALAPPKPALATDSGAKPKSHLFKIKIHVMRTKSNGKAWDVMKGRPDPVFILDGARSAVHKDQYVFSDNFTSPNPKGPWQITILDKDVRKDDLIGEGFVSPGAGQVVGRASVSIGR